jgi:hypothetical protein
MKVQNDIIEFEYLSAVSTSSVGNDAPVTAKAPSSFHAPNAPGESRDVHLEQIEQMGREAITNFNRIFA